MAGMTNTDTNSSNSERGRETERDSSGKRKKRDNKQKAKAGLSRSAYQRGPENVSSLFSSIQAWESETQTSRQKETDSKAKTVLRQVRGV